MKRLLIVLLLASLSSCSKRDTSVKEKVEVTQDYSDFQEVDESEEERTPEEEYLIRMRVSRRTFYI